MLPHDFYMLPHICCRLPYLPLFRTFYMFFDVLQSLRLRQVVQQVIENSRGLGVVGSGGRRFKQQPEGRGIL